LKGDIYGGSNPIKSKFRGGSPLALESFIKSLPTNKKRIIFEKKSSLLDEDNIKE
jgi:hypothetical protein